MYNVFVGVDLHKHKFNYCALADDGQIFEGVHFFNDECLNAFICILNNFRDDECKVSVAVESTGNTRYFKNKLGKEGYKVRIVNTMKFKVINESINKTDKKDASTIAYFLMKDILPESKLCSEKSEQLKRLLNSRRSVVKTIVQLKNQIHGILAGIGIVSKQQCLSSKKGRLKVINSIAESEASNKSIIETLSQTIDALEQQKRELEKKLTEVCGEDKTVKLLMTIPGTGPICAITARAYLDDISRFSHYKKFSSYCGLVPWVSITDETIHYGKITKRGPVELRTAIIQMVMGMIRSKEGRVTRYIDNYYRMKKIKGSGKAIVATARKLTKVIWTMLTNDEEYDALKAVNALYEKNADVRNSA